MSTHAFLSAFFCFFSLISPVPYEPPERVVKILAVSAAVEDDDVANDFLDIMLKDGVPLGRPAKASRAACLAAATSLAVSDWLECELSRSILNSLRAALVGVIDVADDVTELCFFGVKYDWLPPAKSLECSCASV